MSKLARLKELADDWALEAKEAASTAAVCSHFDQVGPHQLIEMWETGKNPQGKPLSQFEAQALGERWCRVFGELPPDDDTTPTEPSGAPEPPLPADDTMLRAKDVVRLTGAVAVHLEAHGDCTPASRSPCVSHPIGLVGQRVM